MKEVRCISCKRKLAEADYIRLEIKCPRCGKMNILKAVEPPILEISQWNRSITTRQIPSFRGSEESADSPTG
ncbi:Com family DNA-binding transcriptional regulator [Quatrionicoccus australiensis]|uniref:Com family DNA-binding transcriptional regulator n=1 Tax=Quatrionicoccus australiensis TaxID=138118 RepID=UPI001CF8C987|nr:Com family DNA-binding transcriptional regulator [Quatrionicoccus australiensis]